MISKTKIYILFVIIISITLIILQILGSKNRIGYLTDFKLNVYKTLELNNLNDIREEFTIDGKLDEENIKNYLLTNENITNYIYQFRIRYYDKVFRNSDIYGVYPDLSNLPDYMKNAEMEKGGSPFGYLTSDKIIDNEEKIDNINYKLRVKPEIINPVIIIFFILIVLLFKNNSKNVFNIITSIFNKKPEESSLNYNQNISEKFIINFLFSLIATIILVFILKLFNLSDVQIYALSVIFITLCFYFISVKNIPFIEKLYNTFIYDEKNRILIYLIILIFIVSLSNTFIELKEWNYLQFLNLNILNILNIWSEKYINDNILPFIIEIILTAFLLYILIRLSNNYLAIFLAIVAVILIIYGKFQVAIIDTHHHTAHFNSVFMVYNHIPYSKNMYSILGHYALLMQPFFKVSLSILWNAETGLVCLASLFISNIYAYCYDLTFKDKKLYYNILLLIIFSICSLLIAYLILNICNIYLLGGEKQNIKDLLFPLITGQVNYTEIKIKKLFNYYFIVVLIFLTTFIYYIKNMRIFNNGDIKLKYYIPSIIYISVCALGVYAYAINRTAFFNSMVLMPMISIIIPFILYRLYLLLNKKSELSLSLYNIILTIFIIGIFSSISISVNNFTNFYNPVSNNFYNYMQTKDDEKNGYTYIVTEFMKEYGFNGISSFGGAFVYGYANLGWTNSLILPNESDWWNPSFGYSNAIKIFMDNKPNIFFSGKTLNVSSFYHNQNYNDSVDLFNKYVENYYTNITTKYEEYGFYLYMLK